MNIRKYANKSGTMQACSSSSDDSSTSHSGTPTPQNDIDNTNLPSAPDQSNVHNTDELMSTARSFGAEDCDDNVDLAPAFTAQDERLEMASLTIDDIVSSQSDLRGNAVASGATRDRALGMSDREASNLLKPLQKALSSLPASKTQAYRRAEAECPELVSPERKEMFLEREDNSIDHASRRLARYWEYRSSLFGDRCYLPMTLSGAMKEEADNLATRKVFQLMPVKDASGRAIIFISPARRNFAEYSVQQEAQALWYLLEACMEDPTVRRAGVVAVVDGRDLQKKHYSRKMKLLVQVMGSVMPVRVRGIHLCYPSKVAYFVLYPVLKQILGRHFRLRFKMHFGTQEKVMRDLAGGYSLPGDRLPVELGGTIALNMDQFLANRIALENSDLGAPSEEPQSTQKSGRTRNNKPMEVTPQPPSFSPPQQPSTSKRKLPPPKLKASSSASQHGARTKESKSTATLKGRRPDPRMARAAQAKMDNPSLTLFDALVIGGYVFNDKKIDQDGTTLRQRTNNLCRRIRLEKERLGEEEYEQEVDKKKKKPKMSKSTEEEDRCHKLDTNEQDLSGASAYGNEVEESPLLEVNPAAVLSSAQLTMGPTDLLTNSPVTTLHAENETRAAQHCRHSHATLETKSSSFDNNDARVTAEAGTEVNGVLERRDSFLEQINKLPGIDDLDLFDIMAEDGETDDLTKLSNMLISE